MLFSLFYIFVTHIWKYQLNLRAKIEYMNNKHIIIIIIIIIIVIIIIFLLL